MKTHEMNHSNLVTSCNFRGKEYLINLYTDKNSGNVEMKVTEKKTLEEWQGTYDASYIENLTQKTGNFKRFDTFISMLKSGLLGTSECVALDLLTFEDLEMLRNRISHNRGYGGPNSSHIMASQTSNRRYLIVTYTVEFDRIHYPLALEYSGLPDPKILLETIKRLEKQVSDLERGGNWKEITDQIDVLQKKLVDVTTENKFLKEQVQALNKMYRNKQPSKDINMLKQSLHDLENKLKLKDGVIERLKRENCRLSLKLDKAQNSERDLRTQTKPYSFDPQVKNTGLLLGMSKKQLSPSIYMNRSLDNYAEKPFSRCVLGGRKVHSARSSLDDMGNISSEDSPVYFRKRQARSKRFQLKPSPRPRSLSPSLSELSHNSEISICACKSCLNSKLYIKEDDTSSGIGKKRVKRIGKASLMKRIRSLEKLVNGIILN